MTTSRKIGVYDLEIGKFQVSTYTEDGIRVRKKFASKKDAEAFARAASRGLVLFSPHANPTLATLIEHYIEDEEKLKQLMRRGSPLVDSLLDCFGPTPIKEVGKLDLEFWLNEFSRNQGFSSRSKKAAKNTLSPFFSDLVERKIIDQNPFKEITVKLGTRKRHHIYLSKNEVVKILADLREVSPDEVYPVSNFFAQTACIPCEAFDLKWADIDFENGFVQFSGTGQTARRKLRMSQTLQTFLKQMPVHSEFVFTDAKKRQWTNSLFNKRRRAAEAAINFPKPWDNFAFRHSAAYHFLRGGGSLASLQVILGHRHIEHTRETYGHIFPAKEILKSGKSLTAQSA